MEPVPTPYYSESGIEIYHGDCREIVPQLKDGGIAIFDPPYGIGVKYGPSYNDNRDTYWEWFLPALDIVRAKFPTSIFTHRNHALKHIQGWDWIGVWNKPGSFGSRIGNSCVLPHWEPIFMYGIHNAGVKTDYLADVLTFNPENNGAGLSSIGREKWKETKFDWHPCPKPVGLFIRLIKAFAQNDEIVVDPFCGSGVTLRAAKEMNQRAIGIEIEERYCEIAAKRLSQEVLQFT